LKGHDFNPPKTDCAHVLKGHDTSASGHNRWVSGHDFSRAASAARSAWALAPEGRSADCPHALKGHDFNRPKTDCAHVLKGHDFNPPKTDCAHVLKGHDFSRAAMAAK
jgi:hypothetical protein